MVNASHPAAWLGRGALALAVVGVSVAGLWIWQSRSPAADDAGAGPVHVHGLGLDPADGALFIATHTGLFRVAPDARRAARVGSSHQDTMGFTVAGKSRFFGSGHPDLRSEWPPLLGLIESNDAGRSWESVSLLGEVDFHVLRYVHGRLYGYDVTGDRLLVSDDEGRSWDEVRRPAPLLDLAIDPRNGRHLVATAASSIGSGLYESLDGGVQWERIGDAVGLLAWPAPDRLYLLTERGELATSSDQGRSFRPRGSTTRSPAALLATSADQLFVALHDGTIERSADGGRTWSVRSSP